MTDDPNLDQPPDTPADPPADDDFDRDRAMHTIKTLREEVRTYKRDAKKAADLETRLRELEDAEKTELQRAQDTVAELRRQQESWDAERRAVAVRLAVHEAATDLGVADVDLALAALDHTQVEYDDGRPVNIAALIEDLLERKPILKAQAKPKPKPPLDGGAGGATSETPDTPLTATEVEWATRLGYKDPADYAADKTRKTLDDFAKTA